MKTRKAIGPLSDEQIAVRWLNAAQGAKRTASYSRVEDVRRQLDELRGLRLKLQEPFSRPLRSLRTQNARVLAGEGGTVVLFPALSTKSQLHRKAVRIENALNRALARYAFRPHVGYSIAFDAWRGDMIPDRNSRWFTTEIVPGTSVSEADAILSLVKLDMIGDLGRVRLCGTCKDRWFVGAKRNYRFCDDKCREAFYKLQPDYLERKKKNQRKYRRTLKRLAARV